MLSGAMSTLYVKQEPWLWRVHVAACVGHLSSAAFFLAFSAEATWSPALEMTYDSWQPISCPYNRTKRCFTQTRVVDTLSLSIVALCVLFTTWSAAAHAVTASSYGWPVYMRDLSQGVSRFRWYDYLISSSLMIVAVAPFAGVVDLWTILGMALMQCVVILMGQASERTSHVDSQWAWFWMAGIFYLGGVWLPLLTTFQRSVADTPVAGGLTAGFLTFFAFYTSFALVAFANLWSRFRHYLRCELAYIMQSLVCKALLVWVLFYSAVSFSQMLANPEFTPTAGPTPSSNSIYMVIGLVLCVGLLLSGGLGWVWARNSGGEVLFVVTRGTPPSLTKPAAKRGFHVQ